MADLTKKNNIEAIVNKITELSRDDKSNLLSFLKSVVNEDIDLSNLVTKSQLTNQINNAQSYADNIIRYNGSTNTINITDNNLNKIIYYKNTNSNISINNNITKDNGWVKLIINIVPSNNKYTISFPKDKYIKYHSGSIKLSEIDNTKEYILIAMIGKQYQSTSAGISYLTSIINITEIIQ